MAWRAWNRYWLAPGGRRSAAALRIAIAVALLWRLWQLHPIAGWTHSPSYYRVGVWMLWPGRPSAELLAAIEVVAWAATLAMLVGAWSRAAHAVSVVAMIALCAYMVSDTPTWSHTDSPPLLASLALLGARSGDAWSVDAWWRRRRGRALPASHYQASVRLVQLTVASVFFVAAYCKIKSGGGLAWALSDNLRNQLLMRFDWIAVPRTAAADWLLAAPWRYELVAVLNLISQASQLAAVFLVRHPIWRALVGALFCAEVLGLGVVMDLWDLHWLPLAAAYVDWDALHAWVTKRREEPPAVAPGGRARVAFASAFVVVLALHAFWLNQRLHLYPLSSFPMFAAVRAKPPYGTHQTYELIGGHIELIASRPTAPRIQSWVDSHGTYRWMWHDRDPVQLRRDLQVIVDEMRATFPDEGVTGVRLWLSVFQAPAVPAPARLDRIDVALIGELRGGTFRTQLGAAPPGAPLAVLRDDLPPAVPFTPPLAGDPVYLIANLPDGPWLVESRSHRGY